jgi:hypothetical protein
MKSQVNRNNHWTCGTMKPKVIFDCIYMVLFNKIYIAWSYSILSLTVVSEQVIFVDNSMNNLFVVNPFVSTKMEDRNNGQRCNNSN